jgi:hypothetical protein
VVGALREGAEVEGLHNVGVVERQHQRHLHERVIVHMQLVGQRRMCYIQDDPSIMAQQLWGKAGAWE